MTDFEKIEIGVHNEIANAEDDRISEVFEEITNFPEVEKFLIRSYAEIRGRCEVYSVDLIFIDAFEGETNQIFSAALMYAMLHASSTLEIINLRLKKSHRDKTKNIKRAVNHLSKASVLVDELRIDLRKYSEFKDIFAAQKQLGRVESYMSRLLEQFEHDSGYRGNVSRNPVRHGFLRAAFKIYCTAIPEYRNCLFDEAHSPQFCTDYFNTGCMGRLYRSCLACSVYKKNSFPSTHLKNILF